jgi:hypothetical protein
MNLKSALTTLVVTMLAATASAKSIGINFVGKNAKMQRLASAAVAGATGVAQSHWNNLVVKNNDANGKYNHGVLKKVMDSGGARVKGLLVKVNTGSDHATKLWSTNGAPWGFKGGNLILQRGILWPRPQITIVGIPYAKYKVYVYLNAEGSGGVGSVAIAAKGHGKVDPTNTYYYHVVWLGGHFKPATATSLKAGRKQKSNCVVFKGNTARKITIKVNGTLAGGWTGVSGVQIVDSGK